MEAGVKSKSRDDNTSTPTTLRTLKTCPKTWEHPKAYWVDQDGVIDKDDAIQAVLMAADDVGKKFVDQQVYKALRSNDYHSILAKIAKMGPDVMKFTKAQVSSGLTDSEKRKFNNFLQKMKDLNVIRSGDVQGEYVFNLRMVRLYIWLDSIRKEREKAA